MRYMTTKGFVGGLIGFFPIRGAAGQHFVGQTVIITAGKWQQVFNFKGAVLSKHILQTNLLTRKGALSLGGVFCLCDPQFVFLGESSTLMHIVINKTQVPQFQLDLAAV